MNFDTMARRHATCPLCHATDLALSDDALAAGGDWCCARCGQRWDARRLANVAAYAAWVLERDEADRANAAPFGEVL
jgi:hypothetical protein